MVDAESALLRAHGHAVEIYSRSNDELQTMSRPQAALSTVWSHRSAADLDRLCASFRPDLIHVHNTFPLISPSLYWTAARRRIPLVQTLHNFRLLCPQAMLFREGTVCEDCIGKLPWRAMTRKCYRGSALQSAVTVGMLAAHRALGTYSHHVDCYIVLNSFCRDKFIEGGLPPERLRIKPNFVQPFPSLEHSRRRGGLFVGRLSHEKGIDVLIDAAAMLASPRLRVIGTGPLESMVREAFRDDYLGFMEAEQVHGHMGGAEFLVVPSIGVETFGLVVVEAFACGTPVIASRLGGLGNLVQDGVTGLLAEPGNASDLAAKITWAHAHPEQMLAMGRAARREYEANFTPERNYQTLIDIYQETMAYRDSQVVIRSWDRH